MDSSTLCFDIEWVLGGKVFKLRRFELVRTTAEREGMTQEYTNRRRPKRKPTSFAEEVVQADAAKKKAKQENKKEQGGSNPTAAAAAAALPNGTKNGSKHGTLKKPNKKQKTGAAAKDTTNNVKRPKKKPAAHNQERAVVMDVPPVDAETAVVVIGDSSSVEGDHTAVAADIASTATGAEASLDVDTTEKVDVVRPVKPTAGGKKIAAKKRPPQPKVGRKRKTPAIEEPAVPAESAASTAMDLYERHRREFERCLSRIEKIDKFGFFLDAVPDEYEEHYDPVDAVASSPGSDNGKMVANKVPLTRSFPSHPPYNWRVVRQRLEQGRYVIDREKLEEEERFRQLKPYYLTLDKKKRPKRGKRLKNADGVNPRVMHKNGVDWITFREDVMGMCQAALERAAQTDQEDTGRPGSLSYAVNKIREVRKSSCYCDLLRRKRAIQILKTDTILQATLQLFERTGTRQIAEMSAADDRHKFFLAVEKRQNTEAAMQTWRKEPFRERRYERLSKDVVCAGLSPLDEQIASYELQTSLKDSFVGLSYKYDDTGQSEAWMKSVVDETGSSIAAQESAKKSTKRIDQARQAALALAADDGVTRAQVTATMQSLLIGVQDRVMTDTNVLHQPELRSANWLKYEKAAREDRSPGQSTNDQRSVSRPDQNVSQDSSSEPLAPDIVEQPVWGIDCYTRRNITVCLETEFDSKTALIFIEKWLLPAINACPIDMAHDLINAARMLEGECVGEEEDSEKQERGTSWSWEHQAPLRHALQKKICESAPPWLKIAANQLKRARIALGLDFFRVHPKGHGSVLLAQRVEPNTLVTFYRGELYPSWRWGEKLDAIDITQQRKNLKPELPDFYNMALERPQIDPRGYGLLFVDASRKAGHGSSLSHSCDPTCEVRVAALNGTLCLSMTTIRELEIGEELTFDYNAVTESLNEYRSAVCLCGYGRCRGSFLHFATADCYQKVLNRNAPIASRFSNLVKGCMKQVMAEDDERVLRSHGFGTAAFGAISVNRRQESDCGWNLADSIEVVPVWLRTFVADTLRYIEYERRALPIALLCDHLASNKQESEENAIDLNKEPKPEPAFFYFLRVESDFLQSLLKKEGFPDTVSGKQRRHALQKVAANYWQDLPEEKKKDWKDKAQAAFEVKKKAWLTAKKNHNPDQIHGKSKPPTGKKGKPEIEDVLGSSTISFVDADAEGVSAMEQRIQHLTQTLSRVGRVLDRHREGSIAQAEELIHSDATSLRKLVHSPIEVARDDQIIGWMWNSRSGVLQSLLNEVSRAKCARPSLMEELSGIRDKFSELESFGDPEGGVAGKAEISSTDGRRRLSEALLCLRKILLDEVKAMGKAWRQYRSLLREAGSVEVEGEAELDGGAEDEENLEAEIGFEAPIEAEVQPEGAVTVEVEGRDTKSVDVSEGMKVEAVAVSNEDLHNAYAGEKATQLPPFDTSASSVAASILVNLLAEVDRQVSMNKCTKNSPDLLKRDAKSVLADNAWLSHYGERFVLLASADLLLFYAHTRNFFLMKPFKPLTSTPIEVYARELGNAVPRVAKDKIVAPTLGASESSCERINYSASPQASKQSESSKSPSSEDELCEPDDIVAEVSVTYNGDYVLAQLLQWYTGGIGQKPGLPDLLGCALLPRMSDCWASELLARNKVKSDRKTTYETKIRRRLIEWLQDPYQRGNPWPDEVKKAFCSSEMDYLQSDTSLVWLPFGSPILDFLVTGEEESIASVLYELDADDTVSLKKSSDGLLLSVDKGRPAQAVSNWVQCENPDCMKWRKIPWFVDLDLLPEKFYCHDNEWDPAANSCDAPEEDWDAQDKLVGDDGKIEGSPVKKDKNASLSPHDESNFYVGGKCSTESDKREI